MTNIKYDPQKHHRRSIRLKEYDYSNPGTYFVTICTHNRQCLFGDVVDGQMRLNNIGQVVTEEWIRSKELRKEIELDEFIVMPNHMHGIVIIPESNPVVVVVVVGATGRSPLLLPKGPASKSIGSLIAGFKAHATKIINVIRATPGAPVWQRNYYEHIIRDDKELLYVREYIAYNPLLWIKDENNE